MAIRKDDADGGEYDARARKFTSTQDRRISGFEMQGIFDFKIHNQGFLYFT